MGSNDGAGPPLQAPKNRAAASMKKPIRGTRGMSTSLSRTGPGRPCAVHGGTWYVRPGSVRGCARPSTTPKRDKGAIALDRKWGVNSSHATPRNREIPGASVTELDTDIRPEEVRDERIPGPAHEPSNWSSANRPGDRRGGSNHRLSSASWSPSGIGGRSRIFRAIAQAELVRRSVVGWERRRTRRRSRSAWMTRAALTRSGS